MTPALLLPAGLAALAALLLPLLIHVARRSQQRPTDFAALRWLRQKPRPRHRLRLDEWPLLLLRLLLLTLLAVWLARPVLHGSASLAPRVAVVPGVDVAQARARAGASGDADPYRSRAHWLAPGFAALEKQPPSPPPSEPLALNSLLRQLDAELPVGAPLTVVVPEVLQGVDAQRPRLSREVRWEVLPGEMTGADPLPTAQAPVLHVRHVPGLEPSLRYLRAAAASWHAPASSDAAADADAKAAVRSGGEKAASTNVAAGTGAPAGAGAQAEVDRGVQQTLSFDAAPLAEPLPPDAMVLVWLSPQPLPAHLLDWVQQGGTALLDSSTPFETTPATVALWRDDRGLALVEAHALGGGRLLRFTRQLRPAVWPELLHPDFPRGLRRVLEPAPAPPARVSARDHAPLAGAKGYPQPPGELRPWLAMLIVLVLLLERWMATRRKRGVAP